MYGTQNSDGGFGVFLKIPGSNMIGSDYISMNLDVGNIDPNGEAVLMFEYCPWSQLECYANKRLKSAENKDSPFCVCCSSLLHCICEAAIKWFHKNSNTCIQFLSIDWYRLFARPDWYKSQLFCKSDANTTWIGFASKARSPVNPNLKTQKYNDPLVPFY